MSWAGFTLSKLSETSKALYCILFQIQELIDTDGTRSLLFILLCYIINKFSEH